MDHPIAIRLILHWEGSNVLGLMNIYGELDSYIFTGGTTSEVVIACIDSFSQSCTESTTIVMD